jgi:hypothetical protein
VTSEIVRGWKVAGFLHMTELDEEWLVIFDVPAKSPKEFDL